MTKLRRTVLISCILDVILICCIFFKSICASQAKAGSALFVFGDSTVDCGNNNQLFTMARATFLPFGRDFDTHTPTGRFTNGRLSIDFLVPGYLTAGDNILQGVNFASAGSGIFNSTGSIFGQHIPLQEQVRYFGNVRNRLIARLGKEATSNLLANSILYISTGSNDYVNNYLLPISPLYLEYTSDEFKEKLISILAQQIELLYDFGARKIVIASFSPFGTVPSVMERYGNESEKGFSFLNVFAQEYNAALFLKLLELRVKLPGSYLIYNNVYNTIQDIILNPQQYGIVHTQTSCCGMGRFGGAIPCLPKLPVCSNASQYVFWDEFHPTSSTYSIIAQRFWSGSIADSFPINIQELATL
ncbi:hypothetical protein O6H91_04G098800 [Diphasiastrum complanatum]|uniref:Uncharacterized protein n=1 Tax=Diphasiastrum complanatum TaxID=34168 RepID=A0ACC2E000_DIPCM|nr:hypothetical protein O6H91_04G098800 [Diphasiastrum complanatum]